MIWLPLAFALSWAMAGLALPHDTSTVAAMMTLALVSGLASVAPP